MNRPGVENPDDIGLSVNRVRMSFPINQNPITKIMNITEIANRLVAHCREAKWEAAQRELFANDAVSIEPKDSPAFEKETKGLEAIVAKGHKFNAMIEKVYSVSVSEPLVATNVFVCTMAMDVKMKGQERMNMSEVCVYQVKDGKIISEHFFA